MTIYINIINNVRNLYSFIISKHHQKWSNGGYKNEL